MNESDSLSSKVIDKADIVSIISEYINLEKKGSDYKGICPFHNDSRPSLSVSPQKKVYKCFSCNAAGNVINFVQRIENISFMDALKKVASKSNIELNLRENPLEQKYAKYHKLLQEVTIAYEFYLKNTVEGENARNYLYKRNISDEIIKRFHIGLSSHKENIIKKVFLEEKHVTPLDLKILGLISINDTGEINDTFKGRIIFPITDLKGNIVGFSGRIYDTTSNAKYVNTHEYDLFKKNQILFNYFGALNDIKQKDQVFIMEGYMDVIAAYRAGITNAIATMGTALTSNQINIISKVTKNIVLCYDGDNAGIEATKRAIGLFANNQIQVSAIELPFGIDPDDYVNKYGNEAFQELLNKKVSAIDYLYNKAKFKYNENKNLLSFQREIYDIIYSVNNKSLQVYLFKRLSDDINVKTEDLFVDYQTYIKDYNSNNKYVKTNETNNDIIDSSYIDTPPLGEAPIYGETPPFGEAPIDNNYPTIDDLFNEPTTNTVKEKRVKEKFIKSEQGILYLAFYNQNDCIKEIRKKLGADDFVDKVNRDILYKLYTYYDLDKEMNLETFEKKLETLERDNFKSIINSCNVYSRECLDEYIHYVKLSKYYRCYEDKRNEIIEKVTKKREKPSLKDLEEFNKNKKKTTKIRK